MKYKSRSSLVTRNLDLELWKESRSGAWANRGFHYQHLVISLILVQQWAGLAPTGNLVPEGLDDCVVEIFGHLTFIQIKSRKNNKFGETEVSKYLANVDSKLAKLSNSKANRSAVILEQSRTKKIDPEITQLFDDDTQNVFICESPSEEIVKLLVTKLEVAEIVAEGLANDLYRLVADASVENASLPFNRRRKISTTEVEYRIFERLKAEDPSAIDHALFSGTLEPIDFTTPINEPDFYRGVKVKVGHVAANLVTDRTNDVDRVLDALWKQRHVLVTGPSGAGKSALVWLAATRITSQMRCFQITGIATTTHAEAIIAFIRARRPSENSPIGLLFDEVGSTNSDLWNVLVHEMRGIPAVYLLGSVRREDVHLITNQSDTNFIPIILEEHLAQTVWEKLSAENQKVWSHWREPFEQSEGLMLEYVHLLTLGKRLAAVIGEQVRQRERENRNDELTILRSAAVICARGGEVAADRLFELLDLKHDAANRAMRRLIDEHLVCESRPGVLGGLHMLRSSALVTESHNETVYLTADTLWKSLPATTNETLPRVVLSILADSTTENESQTLRNLAGILSNSHDIHQWAAILTGLGLATLERHVTSLMSTLNSHGVQRTHWPLAVGFSDPQINFSDLPEASEQLVNLGNAVRAFQNLPKRDLRAICLKHIPEGSESPFCESIHQANKFLACLVPIFGGEPVRTALRYDFSADQDTNNIRKIARLLSTAHSVEPDLAESLVAWFGGEQALFDMFHSQIPWTSPPIIENEGEHGRTIRSNWYHVVEPYQPNPHDTVVDICRILIALSPHSDATASDAVNPMGQPIAVGKFNPVSKNIPSANLPAKARVAWNVASLQVLLAKSSSSSLTDYTHQMGSLVKHTEKVFRSITEKWINGKHVSHANPLITEINEIVETVNTLTYSASQKLPLEMTEPAKASTNDSLGNLLTDVLSNLVRRMSDLNTAKDAATFAGSLANEACEYHQSEIWRTTISPPLKELSDLSDRLADVSCILHEFAHNSKPDFIKRIFKKARKARQGTAIKVIARHSRFLANRRFKNRLRKLERELSERGWCASYLSRTINESDSPYWPACEVAILVNFKDFETQPESWVDEIFSLGKQHLKDDWPFSTVPVMNDQVLASLALRPSYQFPLPDPDFVCNWYTQLDKPIFSSKLTESFDSAIAACIQFSSIIACRDLQNLHREEEEALSKVLDTLKTNREIIANTTAQTKIEHFTLALDYIDQSRDRVFDEYESKKAGRAVESPFCITPHLVLAGEKNEHMAEFDAVRLLLLQEECHLAEYL